MNRTCKHIDMHASVHHKSMQELCMRAWMHQAWMQICMGMHKAKSPHIFSAHAQNFVCSSCTQTGQILTDLYSSSHIAPAHPDFRTAFLALRIDVYPIFHSWNESVWASFWLAGMISPSDARLLANVRCKRSDMATYYSMAPCMAPTASKCFA